MKINVSATEAAFAILGVLGSNSFYEKFDKKIRPNLTFEGFKRNREEIYEAIKGVRSHWNNNDTQNFNDLIERETNLFRCFFENKNADFKDAFCATRKNVVMATKRISGLQNTKASKILHALAPNLIPMIDENQGEFILGKGKYHKNNREDLLKVFEVFHKNLSNEKKKNRKDKENH